MTTDTDPNAAWEAWLATRPPIVRDLARRYPPGTLVQAEGHADRYVVSYGEDGSLGVSRIDPCKDYDGAVNSIELLCAEHVS